MLANQYLDVEPTQEITFNYLPKKTLTATSRLTNVIDKNVVYKMKTNNPKSYLVKPHTGVIKPGECVTIQIAMQPTNLSVNNLEVKDKFLVNAMALPAEANLARYSEYWSQIPESSYQSKKLKVSLRYDQSTTQVAYQQHFNQPIPEEDEQISNENLRSSSTGIMYQGQNPNAQERSPSPLKSSVQEVPLPQQQIQQQENLTSSGVYRSVINNTAQGQQSTMQTTEETKSNMEDLGKQCEELKSIFESQDSANKQLDTQIQNLLDLVKGQEKQLLEMGEEKSRYRSELDNLKSSTSGATAETETKGFDPNGVYQLWHLILVVIVGLIFGAILNH